MYEPLILLRPHVRNSESINKKLRAEHAKKKRAYEREARRLDEQWAREFKCEICEQNFMPIVPWPGMKTPVLVCHQCTRDVPVGMTRNKFGSRSLTHDEARSHGSLFLAMRAAIWHLEKEIER